MAANGNVACSLLIGVLLILWYLYCASLLLLRIILLDTYSSKDMELALRLARRCNHAPELKQDLKSGGAVDFRGP